MLSVTPRRGGLRTWRPSWPMPPQLPMIGTSRPRSWRRNCKRPRPTRSGRGPLWPIVSHGVHPHPKGSGTQGSGSQRSQSASPARGLPPKPQGLPPSNPALAALCRELVCRKVHKLCVRVHNAQFGATGTRRQGEDWRPARLCSGNERKRELICLSNAHAHANFPRWFHWTTIQVVQCDTSQSMPGHRHMKDPSPLSAICAVGCIVVGRSVLKQVECSIVPCKGPRCGSMSMEVVVCVRRPTRAGRAWFSTPKPTTGLLHGRGSAMPLFSTMGATQITSWMGLLMSYWPMAFVLGATSEHRILLVYGRITPCIQP